MYTLQTQKKSTPWLTILAIGLGIALLIAVLFYAASSLSQGNQVTLVASEGAATVPLYDDIALDSSLIILIPNGTRCTKEAGPTTVNVGGKPQNLYQVNCDGVRGHVNAIWVRD